MARECGALDSAAGLAPRGHVCWAFEGRAEYRARAVQYLRDGLAEGQWIEYVGSGNAEALRAELAECDDLNRAFETGAIAVNSVDEFYAFEPETMDDPDKVVDPDSAVLARMEATEQALAAGYTGFRAVVDATAMVRTQRQRRAFAQFEYQIDHQMRRFPVTALCGFDAGELGEAAVAEMACLHPLSNRQAPFRPHAEQGADAALAGAVDERCGALFSRALSRTTALTRGAELVLDGRGLGHIDQQRLRVLNQLAGEHAHTIVLAGASALTERMINSLDLPHVRTRPCYTLEGEGG